MPSRRTPTPPKSRKSRKGTAPANETTDDGASSSSRPLWTGSIAFGLVQIPVRLYPRERSKDLAFHQVDRRDHALIGYERINRNTHRPVAWGDIVKGYEIEKGQFVIVTDEDFEKANVQASRSIEIQDFVPSVAIAPAFFDRPYLALPGKGGDKAYAVLREVLEKKKLAAIGLVVLRTRQHLCAVVPDGDLLSVELLRFAHELRSSRELQRGQDRKSAKPTAKELSLAEQLIERMVVDWDPGRYRDTYRDELLAAIREKADSGAIEPRHVPEKATETPLDLVSLLQKSMAGAKRRKNGKRAA